MIQRTLTLLSIFILISCSSGAGCSDGCDGLSNETYPEPPAVGGEVLDNVVRARLTETALDFLGSSFGALLGGFFTVEGDQTKFYLDETLLGDESPVLVRDGCDGPGGATDPCDPSLQTPPSWLGFSNETLQESLVLSWEDATEDAGPGLRASINNLELDLDMVLLTNFDTDLVPAAACHIRNKPGRAAITVDELSFVLRIAVEDGLVGPTLSLTPEEVVIDLGAGGQLSAVALDITACDGLTPGDEACADPVCDSPDAECPDLCEILDLAGELSDLLLNVFQPVFDELARTLEAVIGDALVAALSDLPLGIEGAVSLKELAGSLLARSSDLALKVAASNNLDIAGPSPGRGLDIGLIGGTSALTTAPCASASTPVDFSQLVGAPPEFTGFVELPSSDGENSVFEAYHVALTISEAFLSQAMYSVFSTGTLCLNLTSSDVAELTDGQFTLTAGLLEGFASEIVGLAEPMAPAAIGIQAREAPRVRIGAGRQLAEGIADPLVEIVMDDLAVDISLFIDGAFHRVAGLSSDLRVAMNVARTDNDVLQLVVEGITVENTEQIYNEIAEGADLSGLFEFMVDFAIQTALGDQLQFELDFADAIGEALGAPVTLNINTVRRDLGADGAAYLSAYATLCSEADLLNESNPACFVPPPSPVDEESTTEAFWRNAPASDQAFPSEGQLRWQAPALPGILEARVDEGIWYQVATESLGDTELQSYALNQSSLNAAGYHEIEFRLRYSHGRYTKTLTLGKRSWLFDSIAPKIVERSEELHPEFWVVREIGSPESLTFEAQDPSTGAWVDWALANKCSVDFRWVDLAGNASEVIRFETKTADGSTTSVSDAIFGTESCDASGSDDASSGCAGGSGAAEILGLWTLGLWYRRRQKKHSPN